MVQAVDVEWQSRVALENARAARRCLHRAQPPLRLAYLGVMLAIHVWLDWNAPVERSRCAQTSSLVERLIELRLNTKICTAISFGRHRGTCGTILFNFLVGQFLKIGLALILRRIWPSV